MKHLTYDKDAVIFTEGSFGKTMYEVCAGTVQIIAGHGSAQETLLATLGPGETFGEMGLFEDAPRAATALSAQDATEVNEIDAQEYLEYFKNRPDKVLSLMRQLTARLRKTDELYQEACQTVFEAIEAEEARRRRSTSLSAKLSNLVRHLRRRTQPRDA